MLNEIQTYSKKQDFFIKDVQYLSETMDEVIVKNDYSIRISKQFSSPVTKNLKTVFNSMITTIQVNDELQFVIAHELAQSTSVNKTLIKILEHLCHYQDWDLAQAWII